MPGFSLFLTTICVLIGLTSSMAAVRAWARRDLPGLHSFPLISLSIVLWSFAESVRLLSNAPLSTVGAIAEILGVGLLPVAWLAFVIDYCGISLPIADTRSQRAGARAAELYWNIRGAALLVALLGSLLLTSADYPQIISGIVLGDNLEAGGYGLIDSLQVAFVSLILIAGTLLLFDHLQRSPRTSKPRIRLTLAGTLVPMIVYTLEIAELHPVESFPLSLPLFAIGQWAFLLFVMRGEFVQILPLAREALIKHVDNGVFVLDRKGVILDLNPAAGQIAAEPDEQVIHHSFPELFPEMRDLYEKAQFGNPTQGEIPMGSGKEKRYFDIRVSPLHQRPGEIDGYLVEMVDITRRKGAETSLRESEERYQLVVNYMQEGIIVHNDLGMIIACNPSAERILGLSSEQLKGRTTTDPRWRIVREDGTPLPGEEHPAIVALHSGLPQTNVVMGMHKPDGALCWMSINAQPLRKDEQSKPYAVVTTLVDITENRNAAQSLQESENRFGEMVESAPIAIIVSNEQGEIRQANTLVERLLGYEHDELIGKPIETLIPERFRQGQDLQPDESTFNDRDLEMAFIDRMEHPADFAAELSVEAIISNSTLPSLTGPNLWIRRKDSSEFPADITLNAIHMSEGPVEIRYLVDITEVKKAEESLLLTNEQVKSSMAEVENRSRELTLLGEMGDMLQSCTSSKEAHFVVASFAEKLFPGCSGALYMSTSEKDTYEAAIAWGENPPGEAMFTSNMCWALRRSRPHAANVTGNGLDCQHVGLQTMLNCSGYICAPMKAQGKIMGVFHLRWNTANQGQDIQLLVITVAEHISMSLANLALREDLRMQSIRDPLTGLFNRQYMEEIFQHEMHRTLRHDAPLGVLMLDIDHFKDYNDTYGNAAGDTVLKTVGDFLLENQRGEDIICRYGGEEFIIILPDTALQESQKVAEKLRRTIHHIRFKHLGQNLREISISIGLASCPEHGRSTEKLIQAAEQALYRAKEAGRDRVRVVN
jgi:diguanylate cyclase (GGDEF)-like protein/PAS domain S-box-containing protein